MESIPKHARGGLTRSDVGCWRPPPFGLHARPLGRWCRMPALDTIAPCQALPHLPVSRRAGQLRRMNFAPDELRALPGPSQDAIHTLDRCIASQHVADVDYTDAAGLRSTIRIRPAFIRYNTAQHLVLWGIPIDDQHWEELRLDRIHGVRDTGEAFTPTW